MTTNEAKISRQISAIARNLTLVKTAIDHDEAPRALKSSDLPAAFTLPGPMPSRDVDSLMSGRASCQVDEYRTYTLRIYILPTTQGQIGEAVNRVVNLITPLSAAFDGRPHLVNADGSTADDFDYSSANVRRAFLVNDTGVVVRPYGDKQYFAIEATIGVDTYRVTSKVEGN